MYSFLFNKPMLKIYTKHNVLFRVCKNCGQGHLIKIKEYIFRTEDEILVYLPNCPNCNSNHNVYNSYQMENLIRKLARTKWAHTFKEPGERSEPI